VIARELELSLVWMPLFDLNASCMLFFGKLLTRILLDNVDVLGAQSLMNLKLDELRF
jgi:hypothetical protein